MKAAIRQDRALLLANARAVAGRLKLRREGTRFRVRIPNRASTTITDGWYASIGDLGKNQPRLQIWLDRFAGYPQRKFYAGFYSSVRHKIFAITKYVSRKLGPVRTVTSEDVSEDKPVSLNNRLGRSEFNAPIIEKYRDGDTFYGLYDRTQEASERISPYFCSRAAAFFEDVARALPHATGEDGERDVYPRYENRKRVASHLQRERSRLLATERKIRDDYKCQACGLRFENVYGKLGIEFAESHHAIPLSQLRGRAKTHIEDLRTVCANCHRMLHKMAGKRDDIKKLRAIVRKHE
jgi:5-methylcytosine-specific restriction endonuclease McrA